MTPSPSHPWELLGSVRTGTGYGFDVYRNRVSQTFFARRIVPGGAAASGKDEAGSLELLTTIYRLAREESL